MELLSTKMFSSSSLDPSRVTLVHHNKNEADAVLAETGFPPLEALKLEEEAHSLCRSRRLYEGPAYSISDLQDSIDTSQDLKDFKIINLVGKGGFGKVYQVIRSSDQRIFAIKTIRKDMVIDMAQV
jgi:hypothetical protein